MQPLIRKATLDDAALLARLNYTVHQLHREADPARYKATTPDSPEVTAAFEARLQSATDILYIAEVAGDAAGFISCQMREVDSNPFVKSGKYLEVDQMSVEASYRRQGIGKALMEQAFTLALEHGIETIRLSVVAFNTGAKRFYDQLGFEVKTHRMARQVPDAD